MYNNKRLEAIRFKIGGYKFSAVYEKPSIYSIIDIVGQYFTPDTLPEATTPLNRTSSLLFAVEPLASRLVELDLWRAFCSEPTIPA